MRSGAAPAGIMTQFKQSEASRQKKAGKKPYARRRFCNFCQAGDKIRRF
jgi:hypothetical protein